jgi:hypothetical protein
MEKSREKKYTLKEIKNLVEANHFVGMNLATEWFIIKLNRITKKLKCNRNLSEKELEIRCIVDPYNFLKEFKPNLDNFDPGDFHRTLLREKFIRDIVVVIGRSKYKDEICERLGVTI